MSEIGEDQASVEARVAEMRRILSAPREPLRDELGEIPRFPRRRCTDEHGRYIPESPEDRKARSDAIRRMLKALRTLPDVDPPGSDQEFFRNMDENRPEGMKLFEGLY